MPGAAPRRVKGSGCGRQPLPWHRRAAPLALRSRAQTWGCLGPNPQIRGHAAPWGCPAGPSRAHGCSRGDAWKRREGRSGDSRHRDGSAAVTPSQKETLTARFGAERARGQPAALGSPDTLPVPPGAAPGASRSLARLHGLARCCTVLYGAVRRCTAAISHQCPLEAAAHSPSRRRAACTVPDTGPRPPDRGRPVPGARFNSELLGRSGCSRGAAGAPGAQDPTCLQRFAGGNPQGPCPKGAPVPPDTLIMKPSRAPSAPIPPCQGGGHPPTHTPQPSPRPSPPPALTGRRPPSSPRPCPAPTVPGESRHPVSTRTPTRRGGGVVPHAGPCPVPAPGCPAGASAPPAAARTRP